MNLSDGLALYKTKYPSEWQLTLEVEQATLEVMDSLGAYGDQPSSTALSKAKDLLIRIEEWKAMCLKDRMGNAQKNSERSVWDAFQGAVRATGDIEALHSIMGLKGFGSSLDPETGQRRAKVATSVLRFLRPVEWGVVDWRTIAMLLQLKRVEENIDLAVASAREQDPNELRRLFDIVNEKTACETNQKYRSMRSAPHLLRAADVDMALFGLSLVAWPL